MQSPAKVEEEKKEPTSEVLKLAQIQLKIQKIKLESKKMNIINKAQQTIMDNQSYVPNNQKRKLRSISRRRIPSAMQNRPASFTEPYNPGESSKMAPSSIRGD